MPAKVILQPSGSGAAAQHYKDTILDPVPVDKILDALDRPERERLAPIFGLRKAIPVWGVVPGDRNVNAGKWKRIERGDVSVFSGENRIFAAATVVDKVHNAALSNALWGRDVDGDTWEYVYFLDDIRLVSIPYADFNRIMEYDPKNIIRGFNVLDQERSERFLAAFELGSDTILPTPTRRDYEAAIRVAPRPDATDREVKALARTEQGFLRNALFGMAATGACCVCGRQLPVELLVAGHIKKRSECSVEERNDYENIVAPMCKLGCDDLYERGFIAVNAEGSIVSFQGIPSTPDLNAQLAQVLDKRCEAWRTGTKRYFQHHFDKARSQFK